MRIQLLLIVSLLVLSFSAKAQDYDPWMKLNQHFFSVNDYFDQLLVRPIALTYTNVTPRFFQAEDGIRDSSTSRGLGDVYKRQAGGYLNYAYPTFTYS